jgi:hypothetical protein
MIFIPSVMLFDNLKRLVLIFSGILILGFTPYTYGQQTQGKLHSIRAKLLDSRDRRPILFAQVINKNMRWGVVSDTSGIFIISANLHDTLYISAIGYFPALIDVADSLIRQIHISEIPLVEQVYELNQVNVYALGTYQQFKYKVLHNKTPDNTVAQMNEKIQKEIAKIPRRPLQAQASIPLGSPITAVYMMLSKEGKGIRKFEKAKENRKTIVYAYSKYNRDIVSHVTGLTGPMLDQFMDFCNFQYEFIIYASEYDIHREILENYDLFLKNYRQNKRK